MGTFLFEATKLLCHFSHRFVFYLPLLIIALPHPALAEGIVQVQPAGFYLPGSPTWTGATPAAVCVSNPNFCGLAPGTLVSNMTCGIVPGSAVYSASFCISYMLPIAPLSSCPPNSTGTPTATNPTICTCDAKFQPDAAGTKCVSGCSVTTKLDDITDPVAQMYEDGTYSSTNLDIAHLTPATQAGLACIQQKVAALNCFMTPRPTSGYRPAAYQKHIFDVYTKWQKLKHDNSPTCAEIKAAIKDEFTFHRHFKHAPGATSNHSQVDAQGNPAGNAVDIDFVPDDANVSADAIACQCNMYRPMANDVVHYQARICPR